MAFGSSQIDTGSGVGLGLRALGFAPGPLGIAGTLAGLGMRGNNLGYSNRARASWGQTGLDFGQTLGALAGLNSYGAGGGRDKLGEFNGVDVTPSGVSTRGGFLGFGGETVGAYTPAEAQRRNAAALYGNSFGTPRQAPTATAVQQAAPTASVPSPSVMAPVKDVPNTARRIQSRDAFDMSGYNADPDPIGEAIRGMMRGGSANGGGRGQGGTGGDRSGGGAGGRSDRSTNSSGRG